ncbi:hypothetical protein DdX_06740 [Ditylenchus destructor]|uniref:Uncharacterized protein n=1 Tax=Ditylenchus destructor TaxID=166010 RepID=A0AAD4NBD6_9BILA|nr:hypothetical protein DdX_06740 [Ditylenchus destructor]
MAKRLKFYKVDDGKVFRHGFIYSFYRDMDPLEPGADPECNQFYHCSRNENDQQKCKAQIYTTEEWKVDKKGREYQYGIFKTEGHSHEPDSGDNTEDVAHIDNHEPMHNESTMDCSFVRECEVNAQETDNGSRSPDRNNHEAIHNESTVDHSTDTTEWHKFYKNDDTSLYRSAYVYSFYGDLDPFEQGTSPGLCLLYHCSQWENRQKKCKAQIYTTGEWKVDKKGREYQYGIFKTEGHSHEPDFGDNTEDVEHIDNHEPMHNESTMDCSFVRESEVDAQETDNGDHSLGPDNNTEEIEHIDNHKNMHNESTMDCSFVRESEVDAQETDNGSHSPDRQITGNAKDSSLTDVYEFNDTDESVMDTEESETVVRKTQQELGGIKNQKTNMGLFQEKWNEVDKKDSGRALRFYKYKNNSVHRAGFVYNFDKKLKSQPHWKWRMRCWRQIERIKNCHACIWTTGEWKVDNEGREYQFGIIVQTHDHEAYQHVLEENNQRNNDTIEIIRFQRYRDRSVHYKGFIYTFNTELKSDPQWKWRMKCQWKRKVGDRNVACNGYIWTTGKWEISEGSEYQSGIIVSQHSHDPFQYLLKGSKFYPYDGTSVQRNGFVYSLRGKMENRSPWTQRMVCGRRINGKQSCHGTIWTTGKWEVDQNGTEYQRGVVISGHSHEPYKIDINNSENVIEDDPNGTQYNNDNTDIPSGSEQLSPQKSSIRRYALRNQTSEETLSSNNTLTVSPTNNGEGPNDSNMETEFEQIDIINGPDEVTKQNTKPGRATPLSQTGKGTPKSRTSVKSALSPTSVPNDSEHLTQQNTPKRRFTLRSQARHVTPQDNRTGRLSPLSIINEKESCFKRPNIKHLSPTEVPNGEQQLSQQSTQTRRASLCSQMETPKASKSANITVSPTNNGEVPTCSNMEMDIEPNDIPIGSEQLIQQNTPRHGAILRSNTSKETPRANKNTRLSLPSTSNGKEPKFRRPRSRRLSLPSNGERHNTEGIYRNCRTSKRPQQSSDEERNIKCSIS